MNFNKTKSFVYKLPHGIKETFKDKRVQKWLAAGVSVYGAPAIYRYITRNVNLPFVPFIESPSEYIPQNLPEKFLVNPVAPGGVGAVLGETLLEKTIEKKASGWKKYASRLLGSLTTTSIWTGIQYTGYVICDKMNYQWPSGGNPFEPPNFYPFNLSIALTLAPLVPYVVDYVKSKLNL